MTVFFINNIGEQNFNKMVIGTDTIPLKLFLKFDPRFEFTALILYKDDIIPTWVVHLHSHNFFLIFKSQFA